MHSNKQENVISSNNKQQQQFMYHHVEELPFDITNRKGEVITFSPLLHLIAGASAGAIEHVCMFPIDTLKTRMQQATVQPMYAHGVVRAVRALAKEHSVSQLYRGMSAVLVGALPSHALYFATYEFVKRTMQQRITTEQQQQHVSFINAALAGICATMMHDAIATPLDVIKQRMQMHDSPYRTMRHCFHALLRNNGLSAFYLSYPTTLLMNIPYASIHFVTYEWMTHVIFGEQDDAHDKEDRSDSRYNMIKHVVSGAVAGACGAAISNPFDVIKTRLQTQVECSSSNNNMQQQQHMHLRGIRDTAAHIYATEGAYGFARGVIPRVLYFMPSAAITWTVYEYIKYMYNKMDS